MFMFTEKRISDLRYFDCLYFCFVALLTIGYGDLSPKSSLGKPFFIVWSIVAVPIVTVLIQAMSKTVVTAVNRGTFRLADFTVMPKKGVFDQFLKGTNNPASVRAWGGEQKGKAPEIGERKWLEDVDPEIAPDEIPPAESSTVNNATQAAELAKMLCETIKAVARDVRIDPGRQYSFEEWRGFTKLIQFTQNGRGGEQLTEWDWIEEDSPLLADVGEAEWILERLVESLGRWVRIVSDVRIVAGV